MVKILVLLRTYWIPWTTSRTMIGKPCSFFYKFVRVSLFSRVEMTKSSERYHLSCMICRPRLSGNSHCCSGKKMITFVMTHMLSSSFQKWTTLKVSNMYCYHVSFAHQIEVCNICVIVCTPFRSKKSSMLIRKCQLNMGTIILIAVWSSQIIYYIVFVICITL